MDVKNISDVSIKEIEEFLNSFDTVVLDCDGVLWNIHDTIPGAKECLEALKSQKKKLRFVTNNSVRPQNDYKEMFKKLDINFDEIDLIHPAKSIINHLKEINFDGLIYCIACSNVKEIFQAAGLKLIDDPMELVPESFSESVKIICRPEPVKAVIIDVDFNISHPKIARAAYFLTDPSVFFIAGASDLHLPVKAGKTIMGPGYFKSIIEQHTKRKAIVLSKPSQDLAKVVVKETGNRCLFIGDMIQQDMGFANNCGYKKLLVLSGGSSKQHLCAIPNDSDLKPDFYGNSLNDLYVAIQKLNNNTVLG